MKTKEIRKIFMCLIMTLGMCFPAFASEQKINYVTVYFNEEKADPGIINPVNLQEGSNEYVITSIEISKDYDRWKPGKKVTYKIEIEPIEGYSFSKKNTNVYVTNVGTTAIQSIKSKKIEIRVNYIPKVTLDKPSNIYYEDEYTACWDEVEYASAYEVNLYKDECFYQSIKVEEPEIDLSEYATDYEDITFSVRAVPKDYEESQYLRNSDWTNCDEPVAASDNTTYGYFYGGYDNYHFRSEDGNDASGWQYINGNWYFFNPNRNNCAIKSAWAFINNKWYYFNDYCVMQTGWLRINGEYYFLHATGEMATKWVQMGPGGYWYYFDETGGFMLKNTTTPDGYYVNSNGEWVY